MNHDEKKLRSFRTGGPLMRVRQPGRPANALSQFLAERRGWLKESEVMTWLHREHAELVKDCVLPEDLEPGPAAVALKLVRAHLNKAGSRRKG